MTTTNTKIRFDKSGYYFVGLMVLVFLGFWNSYFSKFFSGKNNFSFYFHFHAIMMMLWVVILIAQPLLIRKKKIALHLLIGKATYFVMPLLLISLLLLLNIKLKGLSNDEHTFNRILVQFRDIIMLVVAYSIAIYYRHKIQIHARAMIITGIVFIEPALSRFSGGLFSKDYEIIGALLTIFSILGLITALIIIERKQTSGRWLFPSLLVFYIAVYIIMIFQIPLTFLDPLVRWFAKLPLT